MSQNTKPIMLFKDISRKKVIDDFNIIEVSSDSELLFLREVDEKIKFLNRSGYIPDNEYIKGEYND